MDRCRWCSDEIEHHSFSNLSGVVEETIILQESGVRLYDGPNRTTFDHGLLKLTTHRLLWYDSTQPGSCFIALPLAAIVAVRTEGGGGLVRSRTPKLVLRLLTSTALENALNSLPHPPAWIDRWCTGDKSDAPSTVASVVNQSEEDHIKLGFTRTGHREFERALREVLSAKIWAVSTGLGPTGRSTAQSYGTSGIGAIQRQQAARAGVADKSITEAFEDLDQLMSRAREIVNLSRSLSRRVRDSKSGDLTDNETTELRSSMLSMGIMDVTDPKARDSFSRHSSFHIQLAHQISNLLTPLLSQTKSSNLGGNCIDLASAYCRINRARGMNLISPEDMVQACRLLESERLPLRLKCFPSGLLILHLASENETETLNKTAELVTQRQSLTAEELARATNLSALLAKARLLAVEEAGLVCRDDSEAGLRFYPNYFASRS